MERQAVKIVRPARKGKAPLRRRLGGLLFSLFRFCVLFGLIFLIVYPFLFMFVTAFRGSEDLNDPSVVWITRHYTLNNFHNFLQMVDFGDMMGNTVVISLSSAVLQTFVCGLAGYGFARFRFRGRNLLFGLLLFTIIVPPQTYISQLFALFRFFKPLFLTPLLELFTGSSYVNLINTPLPCSSTFTGSSSGDCPGIWRTRPGSTAATRFGRISVSCCPTPAPPSSRCSCCPSCGTGTIPSPRPS